MKKTLFFLILIVSGVFLKAQNSNLILFTENGERFYAILNGLRMNDDALTNVKIEALNASSYKLRVIFENDVLGSMDKTVFIEPGSETTYNIRLNNKGDFVLRLVSAVPIAQAPVAQPATTVIQYGPAPVVTHVGVGATVVEETVTTTTTTGMPGEQVNMNVNVPGVDMNVNINSNVTTSGSISTTTTTTTTTSGVTMTEVAPPVETGCAMMNPNDFQSAKASIKSKSFSDSKMTLAKQITQNNCLTADQIQELMRLFDFESDKLEYAKFAYGFVYDPQNYYKVNDAFEFESSIEELDAYINR